MIHKTVLLKETVDALNPKENGIYCDLTLGAGGHSLEILSRQESLTLIAFDVDNKSIENFEKELGKLGASKTAGSYDDKLIAYSLKLKVIYLVNDNFTNIDKYLNILKIAKLDGIIADLGWSSDQLEGIPGLSYENSLAELDMRFNTALGVKASDLLNALGKRELQMMFENYADIYGNANRRLVDEIMSFKKKKLFSNVGDLINVVDRSFKFENKNRFVKSERLGTLSKVFQSLRIAVNDEYNNLKTMIKESFELLENDGKLAIITFHSGEEKLVKDFLAENSLRSEKLIRPTVDELKGNLRSRSAKLFIIQKIRS